MITDFEFAYVNYVLSFMNEDDWLLEYACSYDMTPNRFIFSSYVEFDRAFISMADSTKMHVLGIGIVYLKCDTCYELTFEKVRHVTELSGNLMSCAILEDYGFQGR